MNRPVILLLIFAVTLMVGACRESGKQAGGPGSGFPKSTETTAVDPVKDSLRINSLFDTLWLLQCAVAEKPADQKKIQDLCEKSIDTLAGCFYVVGKGVRNTDLPEDTQDAFRKTSAKFAAQKWALFLKAKNEGEIISFGETIKGDVLYKKELRSRVSDDSLLVMFMVPVGSVVVKGR